MSFAFRLNLLFKTGNLLLDLGGEIVLGTVVLLAIMVTDGLALTETMLMVSWF